MLLLWSDLPYTAYSFCVHFCVPVQWPDDGPRSGTKLVAK